MLSDQGIPPGEASRADTPLARLRELSHDPALAAQVAANPAAPAELLRELGTSHDGAVLAAVTANPNTPLDTLLVLAGRYPAQFCANPIFPLLLFEYPNFPNEMSEAGLLHLLRYSGLPDSFLAWLRSYGAPAVVEAAELHVNVLGAPEDWAERAQAAFRRTPLASYQDLVLELAALDGIPPLLAPLVAEFRERIEVQRDAHYVSPGRAAELAVAVDPERLEAQADSDDALLRAAVARWPQTPLHLLGRLEFDDMAVVREAVASNPAAPPEMLHRLMIDGIGTRLAVARHPGTAEATLLRLADDVYNPIRWAVLERPDLTAALRQQMLAHVLRTCATGSEPFYRMVAYAHDQTPASFLLTGPAAPDWRCRYALAVNPAAPGAALRLLLDDGNALVRMAAREAIARRPAAPEPAVEPQRWIDGTAAQAALDRLIGDASPQP